MCANVAFGAAMSDWSADTASGSGPVCFAAGTAILTPSGEVPVEHLRPGDAVFTRDNGRQILRWSGMREAPAVGRWAPVEFAKGALGNARPLRVSQQHRMLLSNSRAEMLFGTPDVLVPAINLVNGTDIRLCEGGQVAYVHLLFDAHQIVFAEGIATESLFPGKVAMGALDDAARAEVLALFPELSREYGPTAHLCLRGREAALLMAPRSLPRTTHLVPATIH